MSAVERARALLAALELSRELRDLAERGEIAGVPRLDAERRRLLDSCRPGAAALSSADRAMLEEIATLNDRAVGFLEHHRRLTERDLDMAATGRRAVAAYSSAGRPP